MHVRSRPCMCTRDTDGPDNVVDEDGKSDGDRSKVPHVILVHGRAEDNDDEEEREHKLHEETLRRRVVGV